MLGTPHPQAAEQGAPSMHALTQARAGTWLRLQHGTPSTHHLLAY